MDGNPEEEEAADGVEAAAAVAGNLEAEAVVGTAAAADGNLVEAEVDMEEAAAGKQAVDGAEAVVRLETFTLIGNLTWIIR